MDIKTSGMFREKEFGNYFEFSDDPNIFTDWDRKHGMTHRIFVGQGAETRPARILKTVAYVMIDEDVCEKWNIMKTYIISNCDGIARED